MTIVYGRTPMGQLLYDLVYTHRSAEFIARMHGLDVAEIRRLRKLPEVSALRRKARADRAKAKRL